MHKLLIVVIAGLWCLHSARAVIDIDGDGMSDVWEKRYHAEVVDPEGDDDDDGMTALQESLAGTNPNLDTSNLGITSSQYYAEAMILKWKSEVGVVYQVEKSATLGGLWGEVGAVIHGNGGEVIASFDQSGETRAFYRVKIIGATAFDGLPSEAESIIGVLDYDSDGQDDLSEIRIGTDPFDNSSSLPTIQLSLGSGTTVTWDTQKGKLYRIQSAPNINGPWQDEGLPYPGSGTSMSTSVCFEGGVTKLLRISVEDTDSDGDGATDWEEIQAGLDPYMQKTNTLAEGDLVVLSAALSAPNIVSVKADRAVANITQLEDGEFKIERTGGIGEVIVNYTVSGTAVAGSDYQTLSGEATIPFGENAVIVAVTPLAASAMNMKESVVMALSSSENYTLGAQTSQQVNVIKEVEINVKDYGAVGDGSTNDTAAIQSAIDALEASTTHNTLYFPSGVYILSSITYTPHLNETSNYRILKMGIQDLSGRDLIVRGEEGAVLYSMVSPTRAKMLLVMGTFRSLWFRNMKWEKTSVLLSSSTNKEPNGAAGVTLVDVDDREIESLVFESCEFVNCHRSVTIDVAPYINNGKIKRVGFYHCKLLNPYGANTANQLVRDWGGQQVYISPWAGLAEYKNNLFEGGSDAMDASNSSGNVQKDGCHFGSPLKLIFKGNTVRRMDIEAIAQTNDNDLMGYTSHSFYMPAANGTSTAYIYLKFAPTFVQIGQYVGIPGANNTSNLFRITEIDLTRDRLTVVNDGWPDNVDPGVKIIPSRPIYLQINNPTEALIENNVLERAGYGIVTIAHATVRHNILYGGIVRVYPEFHTPLFPASRGTVIDSNIIRSHSQVGQSSFSHGIYAEGPEPRITNNRLTVNLSTHYAGIRIIGGGAYVARNKITAQEIMVNGYNSPYRAHGISLFGQTSAGAVIDNNHTSGFDVGVGPFIPFSIIEHTVTNHESINDQLSVDPRGLLTE